MNTFTQDTRKTQDLVAHIGGFIQDSLVSVRLYILW